MDKVIKKFIAKEQVLTLSTSTDNKPYSCNCFYAYDEENNEIICSSEYHTKHVQDIHKNNYISGTIYKDTKIIGNIIGVQFNGYIREAKDEELKRAKNVYYKKFPFARAYPSPLWIIELTFVKYTDTKLLGFGKKLTWEKTPEK